MEATKERSTAVAMMVLQTSSHMASVANQSQGRPMNKSTMPIKTNDTFTEYTSICLQFSPRHCV